MTWSRLPHIVKTQPKLTKGELFHLVLGLSANDGSI